MKDAQGALGGHTDPFPVGWPLEPPYPLHGQLWASSFHWVVQLPFMVGASVVVSRRGANGQALLRWSLPIAVRWQDAGHVPTYEKAPEDSLRGPAHGLMTICFQGPRMLDGHPL